MMQLFVPLCLMKVVVGTWVAVIDSGTLEVSRDGSDMRYAVASIAGENIVVDLRRAAIASLTTGAPIQQRSFLEPELVAFSEPTALKTLDVNRLDYVPFQLTWEPPSRGTF